MNNSPTGFPVQVIHLEYKTDFYCIYASLPSYLSPNQEILMNLCSKYKNSIIYPPYKINI